MNKEFIIQFLNNCNITEYHINKNLTVDVYQNVKLINLGSEIPIVFNKIEGDFDCSNNNLNSLKNSPQYVYGTFFCSYNKLNSLEYSPTYVSGNFECAYNEIKSIIGMPKEIGKEFNITNNKVKSLIGWTKVNGDVFLTANPIKTLEFI